MTLWKNGIIHTLNQGKLAKNILTNQGYIVGIDVDERQPCANVADLKGHHLYPGFVDAHLHLIGYGQFLSRMDISHIQDKEIALKMISNQPIESSLIVDGYHEWVGIQKTDLDNIESQKPIILRHHDFHAITVNSSALKPFSLTTNDGILRESDAQTVLKYYSAVTQTTLESYLIQAIKTLYKFGITGGHSDDLFYFNGYSETLQVFLNVLPKYPFRAHLLVHHAVLDEYVNSPYFNHLSPYLELKGVKVFYDGTMSSKTALMYDGYQNSSSKGERTTPDFIEIVQKTRHYGLTLAIHVIGDQGLDEVLDILTKYPPKENQKDRIIHAPWVSEYGMNKLKTIPVTIDIQPQFLSSDFPEASQIFKQFPPYVFPWKTMLKQGLTLSFSSDAPVETPNPLLGILDATKRMAKDGIIYQPEEQITIDQAIKGYTKDANAQNQQPNRGLIDIGYLADFTVFEQALESIDLDRLKEPLVSMTVIDEHIVYQK